MSKLINEDLAEEKEITLSSINNQKSDKSDNSNDNSLKSFKSNISIPKIKFSLKNPEKKFKIEDVQINVERKKQKFKTIMPGNKNETINYKNTKRKKMKTTRVKKKTLKDKKEKIVDKEKEEIKIDEEPEEFEDKELKTKLELVLEKKFSPTESMLSYCKCQLYISYDYNSGFQNTGLEGILCVVINRVFSCLILQIFDVMDFKKQFEVELYTNISLNKGYEILSEKFHTIEYPTFCLGINFYTKKKAEEIKNIILNYNKALNSSLFYMYEKKNHGSFQNQKLFDYILNPKKYIYNNEENEKKIIGDDIKAKQVKNKAKTIIYNKNKDNENNNDYFEQIFNKTIKKLNYKISSDEQMLAFGIDKESNEVIFETSKGANRFLENNNIDVSIINEEYEKAKEKIKSKMKKDKIDTHRTKKDIQEEIKEKENREKIADILNQIDGLQMKDKNNFYNLEEEEEKQKLNNKIKKYNITKRLPINQTLQINAAPDNMVFYEDESGISEDDEEGEENEDDEEGEEVEDNEQSNEQQQINSFNEDNNQLNDNKSNNMEITENNNNIIKKNTNLFFNSRISTINQENKNSSEVSSNSLNDNNIKNSINSHKIENQEKPEEEISNAGNSNEE